VLFHSIPVTDGAAFFGKTVAAKVERGLTDSGFTNEQKIALNGFRFYPPHSPRNAGDTPILWSPPSVSDLKSGPLYGIWATGRFLHNGSVPSLDELLLPAEKRSKVF